MDPCANRHGEGVTPHQQAVAACRQAAIDGLHTTLPPRMRSPADYLGRWVYWLRPYLWIDHNAGERFRSLSEDDQRMFLLFLAEAHDT